MFTWIDMLIAIITSGFITGCVTMMVTLLSVAKGDRTRLEEAYKEGFTNGQKSNKN